jgi:hypothetical protein
MDKLKTGGYKIMKGRRANVGGMTTTNFYGVFRWQIFIIIQKAVVFTALIVLEHVICKITKSVNREQLS